MVDNKFTALSNVCQYFTIRPSPKFFIVRLFNSLLLNLYFELLLS